MRQSNAKRRVQQPDARYESLSSFYAADARRLRSRERDVGLWWRDEVGGPLHRAAWIVETGELYLVRLGPADCGGGEVEVLAHVEDRERLERALRGWRERCGERRSLGWLRARVMRLHGERVAPLDGAARPRAGARAGTMLAAMSSLASELSYRSRPSARATARSPRLSATRLAPGMSLPAK
jgi:hypothetical protein